MADTDIIVSQMPNASQVNASDLVMLTQPNAQAETGYSTAKTTVGAVATKVGNGIEFVTDLSRFADKTLTGAINENKDAILALLPVDEVSGAVANFKTEFALPLIDVKSAIVATEIGSGTKAPDNAYVLGGFSNAGITRSGKNLFNLDYLTASGITIQNGEASGTAQAFFDRFGTNTEGIKQLKFKANTAYTLSLKAYTDGNYTTAGQGIYFRINYTDGNYTTLAINNNQQSYGEFVKTTSSNKTIDRIYIVYNSGYSNTWHLKDIQIEENAEATAFEPYNGTTYSVSWQTEAGEVFGGEVDVTNGKLVVTHHGFTLTGAEEEGWSISNTGTENYYYVVSLPTGSASAVGGSNVANIFPSVNIGNNNTTQGCYNTASALRVRWGTEMTVADWKTWLGTNNLTVVYRLATPVEYDLSDTANISALVGVNNVWSDTNGDTTVDYKLGIQAYIDKKIAEVQALVL